MIVNPSIKCRLQSLSTLSCYTCIVVYFPLNHVVHTTLCNQGMFCVVSPTLLHAQYPFSSCTVFCRNYTHYDFLAPQMFLCYGLHKFWMQVFYDLQHVIWIEQLPANSTETVKLEVKHPFFSVSKHPSMLAFVSMHIQQIKKLRGRGVKRQKQKLLVHSREGEECFGRKTADMSKRRLTHLSARHLQHL